MAAKFLKKYSTYYIILSCRDSKGTRKVKWESTVLSVKNKK